MATGTSNFTRLMVVLGSRMSDIHFRSRVMNMSAAGLKILDQGVIGFSEKLSFVSSISRRGDLEDRKFMFLTSNFQMRWVELLLCFGGQSLGFRVRDQGELRRECL